MTITEYVGDAWYVSDDLREDGAQIEQLMAMRATEHTRALQERFETDFLATAAGPYAAASSGLPINGFDHFIVSANGNGVFLLDHLIDLRLAFDKANVPAEGRVFIVDPVVEATLNKQVSITNDVTQFAAAILERGLASGQRFINNWFGWDIMTSNRLFRGDADDGTTQISDAIFNIGMCILDDQCKPVMAAWRRKPAVEGERNKDYRRDEFVDSARYGFGVQRIDTMACVAVHPTNTVTA